MKGWENINQKSGLFDTEIRHAVMWEQGKGERLNKAPARHGEGGKDLLIGAGTVRVTKKASQN